MLGSGGHYCLTRSFKVADISATQSAKFLDLLWSAGWGFVLFADIPSRHTLIGGRADLRRHHLGGAARVAVAAALSFPSPSRPQPGKCLRKVMGGTPQGTDAASGQRHNARPARSPCPGPAPGTPCTAPSSPPRWLPACCAGPRWPFLRWRGWTIDGQLPDAYPKCVLIAAPHTSNWDLPYTLMVAFALRLNIYWMGKAQIFRWPFGPLMRWLGGIAVDRSQSNNLVAAVGGRAARRRGPGVPGGAARRHAQQNPALEDRLLLDRPAGRRAHRAGLHGLSAQVERPGPGVHRPPAISRPTWCRSRPTTPSTRARTGSSSMPGSDPFARRST